MIFELRLAQYYERGPQRLEIRYRDANGKWGAWTAVPVVFAGEAE